MILMCFCCLLLRAQEHTSTSGWEYSEQADEMTSEKYFFASIYNEQTVENPIISDLTIRYKNGKNEVVFGLSQALFNVDLYGELISVKFDDGKIETFRCSKGANNNFNILFIGSEKKFIRELKNSKKLLIKVNLYKEGDAFFHFNTEGLKWEHI